MTHKMTALVLLAMTLGAANPNRAQAGEGRISYLNCQAANTLGTAAIGLVTDGEVLIHTTSVMGTQDERYDIGHVARVLSNHQGSRVHLVNKEDNKPGVLLVFGREMPTELSRLDGYLYSVPPRFIPGKDSVPAVPVAFVTCSSKF